MRQREESALDIARQRRQRGPCTRNGELTDIGLSFEMACRAGKLLTGNDKSRVTPSCTVVT